MSAQEPSKQIDEILDYLEDNTEGYRIDEAYIKPEAITEAKAKLEGLIIEARNNSLLDLERWIKLHDLGKDMILDGIEHMVKSNLQFPDQQRLDNSNRIAELNKDKGVSNG